MLTGALIILCSAAMMFVVDALQDGSGLLFTPIAWLMSFGGVPFVCIGLFRLFSKIPATIQTVAYAAPAALLTLVVPTTIAGLPDDVGTFIVQTLNGAWGHTGLGVAAIATCLACASPRSVKGSSADRRR